MTYLTAHLHDPVRGEFSHDLAAHHYVLQTHEGVDFAVSGVEIFFDRRTGGSAVRAHDDGILQVYAVGDGVAIPLFLLPASESLVDRLNVELEGRRIIDNVKATLVSLHPVDQGFRP